MAGVASWAVTAVYVAKKAQDRRRIRTAHHRTTSGIGGKFWLVIDTASKINSGWTFNKKDDRNSQQSTIVTAIQSAANMRKTARAFIIPMVTMKLFARPEKPEGVDEKHAYIVGSGLAFSGGGMFPCS